MKEFIEKLVNIQSDLKAKKNKWNDFGKYHYRDCEGILEALKPILKQHGLFLSMTDSIEFHGTRFYVKATATITDGEHEKSVNALAREEETKKGMDSSQITGAASSYARKYALNGLFGIDDNADSDGTNEHGKSDPVKPQTQPAQQQQAPATPPKQEKEKPSSPIRLSPKDEKNPELWPKVLKWLKDNKKTEADWPEIKKKMYLITEADEKLLFQSLEWIPF